MAARNRLEKVHLSLKTGSLLLTFCLWVSANASSPVSAPEASGTVDAICAEDRHRPGQATHRLHRERTESTSPPNATYLDDAAVILEYPSIFDVHTVPDPTRPLRSQYGGFDQESILNDLRPFVDESRYDFVLMFSIRELPGWIHAGGRWNGAPAKNIGQANGNYGGGVTATGWTRLRGTPHMNAVGLYQDWEIFEGSDGGTLVPIHEIGHYWMVNWSRSSNGPRAWRPGDPIAHLAGATAHWSWNWVDTIAGPEDMPGIMYSAPLSYRFNEFDLYAMGLMPYSELAGVSHPIYECAPPDYDACNPGDRHQLTVEHLLESLALEGPEYFEGDGRRIPETDPAARDINVLIVLIKGEDESFDDEIDTTIRAISANLPDAWNVATWGRSKLATRLQAGSPSYRLGGRVEGLAGSSVVLGNSNGDTLWTYKNGEFVFTEPLEEGEAYSVTVIEQPRFPSQKCLVENGNGTIGGSNVTDVLVTCRSFTINPGVNDAWFDPATAGQGLLITTFPDRNEMFLAWFTFDTERPPPEATAQIGEPGHRWLTAQGGYQGDTAVLTLYLTEGGVFDAAEPPAVTDPEGIGSMVIFFANCEEALVAYEMPALGLYGEIGIQRIVPDTVPLCEALAYP